jgi:hypothetical protein
MDVSSFDILPTDEFYDKHAVVTESAPVNDNFKSLGFGSMSFMYNMGSLMAAMMSIPLLMFFTRLLKYCKHKAPKVLRLHRLSNYMETFSFWQYPISIVNESSSVIFMSCLIQYKQPDFETRADKASLILAGIFFVYTSITPFVFAGWAFKNHKLLDDPVFKAKYGAIYEGLNTAANRKFLIQPVFFIVRRFLLAWVVCYNDNLFL